MATLASLQERLLKLQTQAETIEDGGQAYGTGSRSLTRVPINSIYKQIEILESRIAIHPDNGGLSGSQVVFRG